jgi:hypothetical protein
MQATARNMKKMAKKTRPMIFSPVRRARVTYLTESQVSDGTTKRAIIVESRPQYAVLQLEGTDIRYSVAWERVFALAEKNHERNLRFEAAAAQKFLRRKKA